MGCTVKTYTDMNMNLLFTVPTQINQWILTFHCFGLPCLNLFLIITAATSILMCEIFIQVLVQNSFAQRKENGVETIRSMFWKHSSLHRLPFPMLLNLAMIAKSSVARRRPAGVVVSTVDLHANLMQFQTVELFKLGMEELLKGTSHRNQVKHSIVQSV